MFKYATTTAFLLAVLFQSAIAQKPNEIQDDIAMIKKNLADSKASIKGYEWIETTTLFLKDEQKSSTQNQCYYGVDGKLYKVQVGAPSEEKKARGLKGKIVENKKEDIKEYMEKCNQLIKTYLPPDAAKLQQIYASGKTTIQALEPGKKYKLSFPDYNLKGDVLSITIDKEKKMLLGMSVSSYIDKADDKVEFSLNYSALPDNTQYAGETTLHAAAKNVKIVIKNSGFKVAAKK